MLGPNARALACSIIREHFGQDAERVVECLLRHAAGLGMALPDLSRSTGLDLPSLRNVLLVLVQHACVQPFRLSAAEDAGPGLLPVLYLALLGSILHRTRFPKFVKFVQSKLDVEAAEVLEAFAENGRLSFSQLLQRAEAQQAQGDSLREEQKVTLRSRLGASMASLIHERFLERVGHPQPVVQSRAAAADAVLGSSGASRARLKSRPLMEASGYFDSEEQRIVSAARVPELERFLLPAFLQQYLYNGGAVDEALGLGVGKASAAADTMTGAEDLGILGKPVAAQEKGKGKRKRSGAGSDDVAKGKGKRAAKESVDAAAAHAARASQPLRETGAASTGDATPSASLEESSVLWRINHEEFLRRFRHQEVAQFIREVVDPAAGVVAAAMLDAGRAQESSLNCPHSASMSLESIAHAVRHSPDGRTTAMTTDRIRSMLQSMVLHPSNLANRSTDSLGGGHYTLQTGKVIELVKMRQIEAIVTQRFGAPACRIFRMLQKKKCLEQKQIAELAMIPLAQARELLYRLLQEEFVHLQEVPRTADHAPQRTFYLWRVSSSRAAQHVLEHMCKAALNLRLRLDHEMHKEHEVLSLLESIQGTGASSDGWGARGAAAGSEEKQVSLSSGQRAQLERIRKVAAVLETSLLRLDDAIMLFSDF